MIQKSILRTLARFSQQTLKPSKGFQSLTSPTIRQEVLTYNNDKLDALVTVIQSLNNKEIQYLNLLLAQQCLERGESILKNKVISKNGETIDPIQHFYQKQWVKHQWKDTNLLNFIVSSAAEEDVQKEAVAAIRENYDIELTSFDSGQKIKIIKTLRELFGLGLKEAKEFADKVPSMLKKNIKREEAEKIKKDLQAAGCMITLK